MRGSGLWRGGSPGRPPGVPNKATQEVRSFCQRLVADPEYRAAFEQRWRSGTLPPAMEALIWAYAIGKPGQSVEVTSRGLSLAELIVGGVPNDEDLERGEPTASLPSTTAGRSRRHPREATPRPSCPWCGASTSHITLSRCDLIRDAFRRRRRCAECGKRWPTVEGLDVERFTRELQRLGLTLADVGLADETPPR